MRKSRLQTDVFYVRGVDPATYERVVNMAKASRRSISRMVLHLIDTHPSVVVEPKLNGHHEPKAARRVSEKVATSG